MRGGKKHEAFEKRDGQFNEIGISSKESRKKWLLRQQDEASLLKKHGVLAKKRSSVSQDLKV
jgi:hypothetical protein